MTTTLPSEDQLAIVRRWAASNAPAFYATRPGVDYRRGEGDLPDIDDYVDGLVLPFLRGLRVRAVIREHDGALLALRPDKADGVLSQYPRRSLADFLVALAAGLPAPDVAPLDRELIDAVERLRSKPHERYAWDALTRALDRLEGEDPVDLDVDNVRLTPRRTASRPAKSKRDEHLEDFLRTVPHGEHRTAAVVAEYRAAAMRSGVTPIGRTTFLRLADLELGLRIHTAAGQVYRVRPGWTDPLDPLDLSEVLGFTPAPLTADARTRLADALGRHRPPKEHA